MSMLKNKKLGLWLTLTVAVSLALLTILSVVAQNDEILDTYYKVDVSVNDETYGTVEITGGAVDENGNYRYGTDVILKAIPANNGYVFKRWEGSTVSTSNPLSITVVGNCSYKAVFEPMSYKITYGNSDNLQYAPGTVIPDTHVHGTPTKLPIPLDTAGYTFAGWVPESAGKTFAEDFVYNKGDSLGANDYTADITLYPRFVENMYNVTCYDVIENKNGDVLGTTVKEYKYKSSEIPVDFWGAKHYEGYSYTSYINLSEPVRVNTLYNKVYRIYTANTYTVTLDKNAASAVDGDTSVAVVYNQPFPEIDNPPTREGYTLMGYFLDSNGNGTCDFLRGEKMYCLYNRQTNTWSYETWDIAADAKLTALWEKNDYKLGFSEHLVQNFSEITIQAKHLVDENNQPIFYNYQTDIIPYNTELIIKVKVQDGSKLVKWLIGGEETSLRHSDSVTLHFTILGDTVIDGLVLEEIEEPAFRVDYFNELFVYEGGAIPAGVYRLEDANQGLLLKFSVDANGTVTYAFGESLSISELLGTTVSMICCGDGETESDSDPKVLVLAARPGAIELDSNSYPSNKAPTTIEIVFPDGTDWSKWEFACSADKNNLVWQDSYEFTGLKNGTPYYVYVRVAATETAPHGEKTQVGEPINTEHNNYVQAQIDEIIDRKNEGIVGENVEALVSGAIKTLRELQASATFYDDVNAIVRQVLDGLDHARVQDQAVADLKARYDELIASGKYSESLGIPALTALYDGARASIREATTASQVETIRNDTLKNFDMVPISYLFVNEDMRLYAEKGMDKEYRLAMSRIVDLASISAKIQRAVNRGTIVPVGLSMTYSELQNALKTMDVLGYYQLRLSYKSDAAIRTPAEGPYQMRLLLPEDLRDDSGFMVAYYNSVTEEMTVLETVREGNYLIFTAPQSVEDFVILGDHAVNIIPVFAALAVVFLAQIVALAVISKSRRRVRRNARLNGFALPAVVMTIRFFPAPLAQATVILAGLVILMQIILTVLIIKLDLIPRGRRIRYVENTDRVDVPETEAAVAADVEDEAPFADTEEFADDSYEIETETEVPAPSEEETVEAAVDGADFAEESDLPNYSLPTDWFEDEDEADEEISGYSMQYDEDTNGYSLEYDNEEVAYTDAEFDGVGEGFVEYEDAATYEYAEDFEATEDDAEGDEEAYDEAYEEQLDYGYDQTYGEDDTQVVYDYVSAEDVVRDEDYLPEDGMEEDLPEDEFFEM